MRNPIPIKVITVEPKNGWTEVIKAIGECITYLDSLEGEVKKAKISVLKEIRVPWGFPYIQEFNQVYGNPFFEYHHLAEIWLLADLNWCKIVYREVPEWMSVRTLSDLPPAPEAIVEGYPVHSSKNEFGDPPLKIESMFYPHTLEDIEDNYRQAKALTDNAMSDAELLINDPDLLVSTLKERGSRYGAWDDNANVSQDLKSVMRATVGWGILNDWQKEGLEMIVQKIARIINGDPYYEDNWHDIMGYAKLCENKCIQHNKAEDFKYNKRESE